MLCRSLDRTILSASVQAISGASVAWHLRMSVIPPMEYSSSALEWPSSWTRRCARIAGLMRGYCSCSLDEVMSNAFWHISSTPEGTRFDCLIAFTALQASERLLNPASRNASWVGFFNNLRTTFAIIPRVPSLPTKSWVRLRPVAFLPTLAPVQMISPSGRTICRFRTYLLIVPYLHELMLPEFCATFPPMKEW